MEEKIIGMLRSKDSDMVNLGITFLENNYDSSQWTPFLEKAFSICRPNGLCHLIYNWKIVDGHIQLLQDSYVWSKLDTLIVRDPTRLLKLIPK